MIGIASAPAVNNRTNNVHAFIGGALADARDRAALHFGATSQALTDLTAAAICDWVQSYGVRTIVTGYASVGPGRTALEKLTADLANEGISLVQVRRDWDSSAWPEARRGFFAFREKMTALIMCEDAGHSHSFANLQQ